MRTIKSSHEISRILSDGQKVSTPELNIICMNSLNEHDPRGRVAFIAGKKLGNAVWRNRAKRRMRAVCQELNGPFVEKDIVFMARKKIDSVSYSDLIKHTGEALKKFGLLND